MEYGVIYNVFITMFTLLVIAFNAFVMIKYTRKSVYQGFRSSVLIHKVISIHRLYVILWTFFQISSFIFVILDNYTVHIVHGIIMSLYPMIISTTFMYSIRMNKPVNVGININQDPLIKDCMDSIDSEVSQVPLDRKKKSKALVDSMLILNSKAEGKKHIDPSEQAFEYQESKGYWDISENFKEVLRREVLEYIVKAFDVLFEVHRRHGDDNIDAKATMIELKLNSSTLANSKTDDHRGCWNFIFGD